MCDSQIYGDRYVRAFLDSVHTIIHTALEMPGLP